MIRLFLNTQVDVSTGDSLLIALVCMLIVFAMLAVLWGIVSLFKLLPKPKEKKVEATAVNNTVNTEAKKSIKLEDIKDDDMMVAALVATIEYHNEIGKDVKVTSIKEL